MCYDYKNNRVHIMATKFVTLQETPTQLSDGSKRVHCTLEEGSQFYYCVQKEKPNEKTAFHSWRMPIMNIEKGFPVWAWDVDADIINSPVSLAVSEDLSDE